MTATAQIHIFETKHDKTTLMIAEGKAFKIDENSWSDDSTNEIPMDYAMTIFKVMMDRVKVGEKTYTRVS